MKLVCDIASMPKGLDIANFTKIFEQHHVVFWDSTRGGTKPKMYKEDETEMELALVDTKGNEIDADQYQREFEDAAFWDKELHNCKASPVYFFNNYGTTQWPATSADIQKYMLAIGLINIETEDTDEAADLWEKQKAQMKIATDTYTIAFLKERQAAVQVLKTEYYVKVEGIEEKVKEKVGLFDNKGVALSDNKRITNLVEKIRRINPIPPQYSEVYRNAKGKWDVKILFNTPYGVILEMFYDLQCIKDRGENVLDAKSK
jgi:hypothetical protein